MVIGCLCAEEIIILSLQNPYMVHITVPILNMRILKLTELKLWD